MKRYQNSEKGFTLIETTIALLVLGMCLMFAMPLILYAQVGNNRNEIRNGALVVSQRVFDDIRSQNLSSLPLSDGNIPTATNPVNLPVDSTHPMNEEAAITKVLGRQYQTKITYCPDITTDPTVCSIEHRSFKVEVSYNDSKVYDLEGTYTSFK
jgi:prepilin-type N-terminal cleavage/methylation domain-containing protein